MRFRKVVPLLVAVVFRAGLGWSAPPEVTIEKASNADRYDVTIGGKAFTSYCYDEQQFKDKPIFWPVLSLGGRPVNRSYPMIKGVAGEATDHPHHQSLFFTYDEVNGIHYWNINMSGRRIRNRSAKAEGNKLSLVLEWNDPQGQSVLVEHRDVTFGGEGDLRWMDHDITLAAQERDVEFGDTKEGAFGIRLARSLQENGGTGKYINAEGLETSRQVWGKPSPWVAIRGALKDDAGNEEPVTVAIFSHPTSLNQPPYWHARDYGLFTVNPFGRKSYDKTAPERKIQLKAGDNVHLRYRVAVYAGQVEKTRLDSDFENFAK